MADRDGSVVALNEVEVTLSAVLRTRMPVAATTGRTIAAQSTPPSPAASSKRPRALALLDPNRLAQSGSCTVQGYAGAQGTGPLYSAARAARCHFVTLGSLPVAYVTSPRRVHSPKGLSLKWSLW